MLSFSGLVFSAAVVPLNLSVVTGMLNKGEANLSVCQWIIRSWLRFPPFFFFFLFKNFIYLFFGSASQQIFQTWPRFAPLSFSGSVFESVNLFHRGWDSFFSFPAGQSLSRWMSRLARLLLRVLGFESVTLFFYFFWDIVHLLFIGLALRSANLLFMRFPCLSFSK